jgi:hypothetical protein
MSEVPDLISDRATPTPSASSILTPIEEPLFDGSTILSPHLLPPVSQANDSDHQFPVSSAVWGIGNAPMYQNHGYRSMPKGKTEG